MIILYIGQLRFGGTCLDRMQALRRLGHDVIGFDVANFTSKYRLIKSLQCRFNISFLLNSLNAELVRFADNFDILDLIWVDKGVWIFPDTLRHLRIKTNAKIIHYTPDAQLIDNISKHFINGIMEYDYLFTTKSFEIEKYIKYRAKSINLITQSFCPIRFYKPQSDAKFNCSIGFISDYKVSYGKVINILSSNIDSVRVWGPKWPRAAKIGLIKNEVVAGNGLWGPNYINGLASFDIGLGLLSKYIPELHTTRSVEIPAAGTFLLAERTIEHEAMFEEGVEAEYFGSVDELISKAKFYLSHDAARKKIAKNGRERCFKSGYDIDSTIKKIINLIST